MPDTNKEAAEYKSSYNPDALFLCGCGQYWYDLITLLKGNTPCGCTPTMVVVYGKK